ncbi:hypothetical protein E1178_02645 [Roseibium hamelinense]|nr:hypothetical protein [Roseibium hamelinense]
MVGLMLLGIAVVALIADGSRSIAENSLTVVPLGQAWFTYSPDTLNIAQAAIQRHVNPYLWDPVIQTVLTWPVWAVAAPLGLIFLALGARRQKRKSALA